MGLEFKIEQSERKLLDKVTCDGCGKEIKKITEGGWNLCGEPYSNFHEPSFEDFFQISKMWGYFSKKDGKQHEAVICEECYDKIFHGVTIHVTNYF